MTACVTTAQPFTSPRHLIANDSVEISLAHLSRGMDAEDCRPLATFEAALAINDTRCGGSCKPTPKSVHFITSEQNPSHQQRQHSNYHHLTTIHKIARCNPPQTGMCFRHSCFCLQLFVLLVGFILPSASATCINANRPRASYTFSGCYNGCSGTWGNAVLDSGSGWSTPVRCQPPPLHVIDATRRSARYLKTFTEQRGSESVAST